MYVLFIDTHIAPERTWSMAKHHPLGFFFSAKSSDQWIGAAVFLALSDYTSEKY